MNSTNQTKARMLSGIIEVKELTRLQDVNSHIEKGWKLLNTFQTTGSYKKPMIKYCVGWPKSAGNINMGMNTQQNTLEHKQHTDRKKFIYSL